ncbi:reticulon-like protein B21 isoform X2 [Magnolia sinica]|uniref:reticulon-like protein B21 isoform X2 n=1 Tax=Magnolia sinica TaxID=86752 RepID=UPI002659E186|nr:reticulon-like protein B21 isoform X2 [Magnolia sinica]
MQANRRRATTKNAVVAGSVWETRMKIDEGKGGIKVFNGGDRRDDSGGIVAGFRVYRRLKRNQSDSVAEGRRKWKSESEKSPIQLRKTRSEPRSGVVAVAAAAAAAAASDENCKELGVEKKVSEGSPSNVGPTGSPKLAVESVDNGVGDKEDGEFEEEEEEEEEIEIEKESFDIKEVNSTEEKMAKVVGEEEKKDEQIYEKTPIWVNAEKDPPHVIEHPAIDPDLSKLPSNAFGEGIQETQNRMQNIVDLVMWRDISKSAFVFGLGTFILLSSSFTKDLNFSLISAISYLGLVYLGVIFFYKSIICRGLVDFDESNEKYMVVGEEEAIWIIRMILPYFNELLFKIRGLFSGDPATTMKLAILLFVLARCGSSITIWTMGRFAFFAVFTLPKFCSAYSSQLSGYGEFWVRRFQDAWDTCTHKKAVAAAIFTVIWNLSSVVARIWAAFMLVVAVRFYQQSLLRDEWVEDEVHEDSNGGQELTNKTGPTFIMKGGPTITEVAKEKKGS